MRAFALLLFCASEALAADVVVESEGAAPQRLLRYDIPDGTRQKAHVQFDITLYMNMAGTEQGGRAPTVDAWLDVRTRRDGDAFEIAYKYTKIKVSGGEGVLASDEMKERLLSLKGLKGTMRMSSTGAYLDDQVTSVTDDGQKFKSAFEMKDLAVRLPDVPVGVGAVWTVSSDVPTDLGITLHQVSRMTLNGIDGDRLTLSSTLTQSGDPGPISGGDAAALGAQVELIESSAVGDTTSTLSLVQPLAVELRSSIGQQMAMSMTMMGMKQEIVQRMTMTMSMTEK
jgi:hypothetical protein